ncbi:MAG: PqqD family protein [Chloroflexota bacterium]
MVTPKSSLSIPADVLFHELAGEAVLLNLATGKYFGLDEVGTRMWQLLAEHHQTEPVVQALLQEYDVPEEQLRSDLLVLVDKLIEHGLVQPA